MTTTDTQGTHQPVSHTQLYRIYSQGDWAALDDALERDAPIITRVNPYQDGSIEATAWYCGYISHVLRQ